MAGIAFFAPAPGKLVGLPGYSFPPNPRALPDPPASIRPAATHQSRPARGRASRTSARSHRLTCCHGPSRASVAQYSNCRTSAPISVVRGRPVEIAETVVKHRLEFELPVALDRASPPALGLHRRPASRFGPGLNTINCDFLVGERELAGWSSPPVWATTGKGRFDSRSMDSTARPCRWRGRCIRRLAAPP